jgi:hypothetical protein
VTDTPDELLTAATAALREAASLRQRLATAHSKAEASATAAEVARQHIAEEARDVRKLKSLSLTKILAHLNGSYDDALARETAQQQAAEYTYAARQAAADADRSVVDALQRQLAALGDVDEAYHRALAVKENWLQRNGGATSFKLLEFAQQRGRLIAELKEISEAQAAGEAALRELHGAAELLNDARYLSSYDKVANGEFLGAAIKWQMLDDAADQLRAADLALKTFTTELADIRADGLRLAELDDFTTYFDTWLGTIFSDRAVRERISEAHATVVSTIDATNGVWVNLEERRLRLANEFAQLKAQRDAFVLRA